ncbi:MAG: hypothetical protein CMB93_00390 [Flammeovirgaceae bacterium]|nr:hypothetical protein [Flammeovirgaceae bacterium]
MIQYLKITSLILFCSISQFNLADDKQADELLKGSTWQLIRNGSYSQSHGVGQVVYFLSSDAYHTHRSRKNQMWDAFSPVDARNLVRLKKNDELTIIDTRFNGAIHEVKLLNGFYKGKTYFLIADELEKNFKKETEEDEKT